MPTGVFVPSGRPGGAVEPTVFPLDTGSVLFADADGEITEDNANLFFDDTNNELVAGPRASVTAPGALGSGRFVAPAIGRPGLVVQGLAGQTQALHEARNNLAALLFSVSAAGAGFFASSVEIDGALDHDGTTAGFFSAVPVVQPALTADLLDSLQSLGLIASGIGDTPLNLTAGALVAGTGTFSGKVTAQGEVEIDGALNHDGTTVGFFGVIPAVRPAAYTPTNVTTDRAFDANATTLDEIADVLGTLIADMQSLGLVG